MCVDPSTMALALAVTSASVSAYSAYDTAQTQKAVAAHNADVAKLQADDARRRGEDARIKVRQQASVLQGRQRAMLAARGLDLNEGTPSDILGQSEFFAQSDEATARTNARREAWAHEAQMRNYQAGADGINPGLSMASSLLASSGQVSDRWYAYQKQRPPGG